ncbi:hypothetical protein PPACK8108_LOCUS1099 [Phakopsora pachyrhizi]|uniref:Uncharacterized protein n=1 Tax=Phakopsora pachyrhizi TaxID=170000 RepID=A0AAV0AHS9_PHAPC|nr:hypothetical protein PPACK8108_LOCUS1099 [Phakopsora pachyrhizi]
MKSPVGIYYETLKRKEISLVDPINIGNTDNDYVSNNNIISSNRSNRTHSIRVIADEYDDGDRSSCGAVRSSNHSIIDRGNPIHRTTTALIITLLLQRVVTGLNRSIKNHLFEHHFNSSSMTRLIASNSNKNHINFRIAFTINFDFRRVGSKLTNFLGGHVTALEYIKHEAFGDLYVELLKIPFYGVISPFPLGRFGDFTRNPSDPRAYTNQTASNSKLPALPEALKDTDSAIEDQSNHESHPHTIFIQKWWDETLPRLPERTTAAQNSRQSAEPLLLKKKEKNSSLTPEMREKIELKKRQAQGIKAQRIRAALEAERIQNEKKVVAGERCLREDLTVELDHLMRSRWLLRKKILSSGKSKLYMTDPRCSEDQLKVLDLVCDCYPEASPFSSTGWKLWTRISRGNSVVDPSSSIALVFLCGGGWLKFPSEWGNMGDEINLEEGGRSLSSRAKDQREQELELGDSGMAEGLRGGDCRLEKSGPGCRVRHVGGAFGSGNPELRRFDWIPGADRKRGRRRREESGGSYQRTSPSSVTGAGPRIGDWRRLIEGGGKERMGGVDEEEEEGAGWKGKMGAVCGQAAPAPEQREAKSDRASGAGPGRVIPERGSKYDPRTMQGVLDWIRAGLFEDRGIRRMGMDGAEEGHGRLTGGSGVRRSWKGDDGDIIRAGGGCGGRNGKGRMGKGGAESAPGVLRVGFWRILQDFEEEGVTVEGNGWHYWKEGQTLGGGAHQGRSGWSKTTGAMDFFKEAPDLEEVDGEDRPVLYESITFSSVELPVIEPDSLPSSTISNSLAAVRINPIRPFLTTATSAIELVNLGPIDPAQSDQNPAPVLTPDIQPAKISIEEEYSLYIYFRASFSVRHEDICCHNDHVGVVSRGLAL